MGKSNKDKSFAKKCLPKCFFEIFYKYLQEKSNNIIGNIRIVIVFGNMGTFEMNA